MKRVVSLEDALNQGIARQEPDLLHPFAEPVEVAHRWLKGPVHFCRLPSLDRLLFMPFSSPPKTNSDLAYTILRFLTSLQRGARRHFLMPPPDERVVYRKSQCHQIDMHGVEPEHPFRIL
jgi:hypothetical protein